MKTIQLKSTLFTFCTFFQNTLQDGNSGTYLKFKGSFQCQWNLPKLKEMRSDLTYWVNFVHPLFFQSLWNLCYNPPDNEKLRLILCDRISCPKNPRCKNISHEYSQNFVLSKTLFCDLGIFSVPFIINTNCDFY